MKKLWMRAIVAVIGTGAMLVGAGAPHLGRR